MSPEDFMDARGLDPARWFQLVQPAFSLDQPVVPGLLLYDFRCSDDGWGLLLELTEEGGAGVVELRLIFRNGVRGEIKEAPDALQSVAKKALQRVLVRTTERLRGRRPRWFRLEREEPLVPPEGVVAWPRCDLPERHPERPLVLQDAGNYRLAFGGVSTVHRAADGVFSVHYPAARRTPPTGALFQIPQRLAMRRRYRAYLARLGFSLDEARLGRTVPTPCSFALAAAREGISPGVKVELVGERVSAQPGVLWLGNLLFGRLRTTVTHPGLARLHGLLPDALAAKVAIDVGLLPHDMSVHMLAFHRIPAAAWEELTSAARRLVLARPVLAFQELAGRFEGPLTRALWKLWEEGLSPAGFDALLARRLGDLKRVLSEGESWC